MNISAFKLSTIQETWMMAEKVLVLNQDNIRDFKIWNGEVVVRRQKVKITSGDVMTRATAFAP